MKTLLAVDGNSILCRAFYGIRPLTTHTGLFTNAVYGFATILSKHIENLKPDALAVAFDVKAPTFRHEKFDEYKAGRKAMPDELGMQFPYAKRLAAALGAKVLELPGWEADDILGTLSRTAEKEDYRAYLLTGDRDSLQLIDASTTVLLASNSDTINFDEEHFRETYGVGPDQFVDVKALMGDKSDNIPGVPGIGEKTALKLISDFGSLDGVYKAIDDSAGAQIPTIAKGVRAKLETGRESAYLSRYLAKIDTAAPLGVTADDLATDGYRRDELKALFTELEFTGLIKRFGLEGQETAQDTRKKPEIEAKNVNADEFLRAVVSFDKVALASTPGTVQLSGDGKTMLETPLNRPRENLLCELFSRADEYAGGEGKAYRMESIVYDSKKLWNENPMLPADFSFGFDVMLAAYVADPSEGAYTADRLRIRYLGGDETKTSEESLNAAEIYLIADKLDNTLRERGQEKLLHEIEMPLAKVLSGMESAGFKVDTEGLRSFSDKLGEAAETLKERIYALSGCEFNINSPKQLGEVLFERLGLPAGKKTKSGYSTSADILERLAPISPVVMDILDYRQLTKLRSTYGEGLVKAADGNGLIHTSFNQTITATGRLSSTEPNLQNIPVRTDLGRELRRFFIPRDEGRVLIDADYSQIELRLLAHISGDETLINAFRNGIDIHTLTASQVFGVPEDEVTSEMRKRAKAVNFGIVYGIGDYSLAQDIGVTKREAAAYISAYLAKYPKVGKYLKDVVAKAHEDGYVTTMFGRRRYIPELTSQKKMMQAFGERVAMNSPIQGSAADIIKIAMINADKALKESGLDAILILQVHDELIVDAAEKDADAAKEILVREMESAAKLSVPLTVSSAVGKTWYDCKD